VGAGPCCGAGNGEITVLQVDGRAIVEHECTVGHDDRLALVEHQRNGELFAIFKLDGKPIPATGPNGDEVPPLVVEPRFAGDIHWRTRDGERAGEMHSRAGVVVGTTGRPEVDVTDSVVQYGWLRRRQAQVDGESVHVGNEMVFPECARHRPAVKIQREASFGRSHRSRPGLLSPEEALVRRVSDGEVGCVVGRKLPTNSLEDDELEAVAPTI
jgi:hypothetical protein